MAISIDDVLDGDSGEEKHPDLLPKMQEQLDRALGYLLSLDLQQVADEHRGRLSPQIRQFEYTSQAVMQAAESRRDDLNVLDPADTERLFDLLHQVAIAAEAIWTEAFLEAEPKVIDVTRLLIHLESFNAVAAGALYRVIDNATGIIRQLAERTAEMQSLLHRRAIERIESGFREVSLQAGTDADKWLKRLIGFSLATFVLILISPGDGTESPISIFGHSSKHFTWDALKGILLALIPASLATLAAKQVVVTNRWRRASRHRAGVAATLDQLRASSVSHEAGQRLVESVASDLLSVDPRDEVGGRSDGHGMGATAIVQDAMSLARDAMKAQNSK